MLSWSRLLSSEVLPQTLFNKAFKHGLHILQTQEPIWLISINSVL